MGDGLLPLFLLALGLQIDGIVSACSCDAGQLYEPGKKCVTLASSPSASGLAAFNAQCLQYGGNLYAIHSQHEQEFVYGVLNQVGLTRPKDDTGGVSVWLGLRVDKNAWTDGSAVDYTHWDGGKPSGAGQCARLELAKEGQWGDIDCNNSVLKHAVCQIPAKC